MSGSFAFSVPIGAYHPLLRDCLQSLNIQTPRPRVAVLDASGDPRVADVVAEFSDLVTYHRSGPDGGQTDAIIEGWDNVEGDILGWLNADDALYPDALAAASRRFTEYPETDVFYGHSVIIDDDDAVKGYHWAVEPPSERILSGGIISQPSCFFRRSLVEKVGGIDRDLHYTMDWDLWIRFWRADGKFAFSEDVFSRVLWSGDAKTGGFGAPRRRELERLISQNASFERRLKSRLGFALHHAFEYLLPGAVTQAVRRRSARRGSAIHGLDRAGGVRGEARLPIIHYDRGGKRGVVLTVGGDTTARLEISAEGAMVETDGPGVYELRFQEAVPEGRTVTLDLKSLGGGQAAMLKAAWL